MLPPAFAVLLAARRALQSWRYDRVAVKYFYNRPQPTKKE